MIPAELIIRHFPFLVEKELKDAFSENCVYKSFPSGTVLLKEEDTVHFLPLLVKGSLKVTRTDRTGRDILLYYISAGESCIASYAAALFHEASRVRAVTEDDCDLVLLPVKFLDEWARLFPSWNLFIVRLYYRRFEELLESFNSLAFQKLDERLADHLKRKSQLQGNTSITVTHQQLADDLGTAREVVSRLLKSWESEGKVELSRGMIKISRSL